MTHQNFSSFLWPWVKALMAPSPRGPGVNNIENTPYLTLIGTFWEKLQRLLMTSQNFNFTNTDWSLMLGPVQKKEQKNHRTETSYSHFMHHSDLYICTFCIFETWEVLCDLGPSAVLFLSDNDFKSLLAFPRRWWDLWPMSYVLNHFLSAAWLNK